MKISKVTKWQTFLMFYENSKERIQCFLLLDVSIVFDVAWIYLSVTLQKNLHFLLMLCIDRISQITYGNNGHGSKKRKMFLDIFFLGISVVVRSIIVKRKIYRESINRSICFINQTSVIKHENKLHFNTWYKTATTIKKYSLK